jgi:hypothetical protein
VPDLPRVGQAVTTPAERARARQVVDDVLSAILDHGADLDLRTYVAAIADNLTEVEVVELLILAAALFAERGA